MSKQIVFTFDTTGSMYPALTQVRRNVSETVKRLFRDIPDLKIGVIAHGDYCDRNTTYVTKHLDLTDDEAKIVRFVNTVGATGGGDAAECYELVLREARQDISWEAGDTKVLVMIGDDLPHDKNERQNTLKIDWRNEVGLLKEAGIHVYGVQALGRHYATNFYDEISSGSGGIHLNLDQFAHVQDLIFAVCYRQQGEDALSAYEAEVTKAGRMNRSMDQLFERLYGKTTKPRAARTARKDTYAPTSLKAVHPSRFQVLHVDRDSTIRDFVEDNGLAFKIGRGFYELTKTVKVQHHKEVVLQDRRTGDFFNGDAARDLLGLPHGEDAKLRPVALDKYRVFIQSTSVNRKLLGDTSFLYEVDETLR